MRPILPIALALLGAPGARAADVLVFAGQSNMSGFQTSVDQIPPEQAAVAAPNPAVRILLPTAGPPPSGAYWLPGASAWEAYAPYTPRDAAHWWQYPDPGDWQLGQTKSFGPGATAARAVQAGRGGTLYVAKYAVGGTTLAGNWDSRAPDPAGSLSLYHTMIAWTRVALAGVPDARVVGFFWMQGESDGDAQASAEAYAANFTAFIASLRADLAAPDLPVVFGQVSPFGHDTGPGFAYLWRDTIRAQQATVARTVARTAMVATDDLALAPNGMGTDGVPNQIHFTTASQLVLGQRMGDAFLALAGAGGGSGGGSTGGVGSAPSRPSAGAHHGCGAGSGLAGAAGLALSLLLGGRRSAASASRPTAARRGDARIARRHPAR